MFCAPFENSIVVCSDWERPTRSKSLKSGSCTSAPCDAEGTVTRTCRLSVPSTATSSASVEAWIWTSSAARAPAAQSPTNRRTALPVLLDIAPPLPLLPGETPYLEILLAGLQRVQKPLRLAPVQRLFAILRPCLGRIAALRLPGIRLLLTRRALLLARFLLRFLRLSLLGPLLVLGRLGLVVLLFFAGFRRLVVLGLTALLLHLLVVLALLLLVLLLLGAAHRSGLLLALLLAQEQLEVDLGVGVGRVEGERLRVRVHGVL